MKRKLPLNTTCRLEQGGCGGQVVITTEPYTHQFGDSRRAGTREVAVHEDELAGRRPVRVDARRFYTLREVLEVNCAAKNS